VSATGRVGRLPRIGASAWTSIVVATVVIALVPLLTSNQYLLTVMVTAMITLVLNTSWNFVLGVAGAWNFGMLAIYAIGGYSAGLMMLHLGLPAWIAIPLGGLAAGGVSLLLAFPTLRLFGIYTSLLTFSFAQVVQFVIVNDPKGLTGGTYGFPTVGGLYPNLGLLAQVRAYYWTILAVVIVSTLVVARIRSSRLGIALQTIRDAPAYAAARGVSPLRYRMLAFGISGFIAGVAGALYVSYNQSITASVMGLTPMSIDVTMLVIGGLGTIFGPILGTGLLTVIQQALIDYPGIQLTILGVILLVVVVFAPNGLVGMISRLRRRIAGWVAEGEEELDDEDLGTAPTAAIEEPSAGDPSR
jgi:branched-chain amino acid transport system permease protein